MGCRQADPLTGEHCDRGSRVDFANALPTPPRSGPVLRAVGSAIAATAGSEMAAAPPAFSSTWPSSMASTTSRSTWRGESPAACGCGARRPGSSPHGLLQKPPWGPSTLSSVVPERLGPETPLLSPQLHSDPNQRFHLCKSSGVELSGKEHTHTPASTA